MHVVHDNMCNLQLKRIDYLRLFPPPFCRIPSLSVIQFHEGGVRSTIKTPVHTMLTEL